MCISFGDDHLTKLLSDDFYCGLKLSKTSEKSLAVREGIRERLNRSTSHLAKNSILLRVVNCQIFFDHMWFNFNSFSLCQVTLSKEIFKKVYFSNSSLIAKCAKRATNTPVSANKLNSKCLYHLNKYLRWFLDSCLSKQLRRCKLIELEANPVILVLIKQIHSMLIFSLPACVAAINVITVH